jgi:aryl-alcohol dehydrogenase-like predicted oxidoreductase
MKHISLNGLDVSRIGLGTMAMSGYYLDPSSSDAESIRTIQRALELGITHIDTAEIYGPYANEELVGRALKGRRDDVVVATKFGFVSHSGGGPGVLDSSPGNIRTAVEGSLKRLGTDHVDLYYQHRVDPNTPIEDTVGALAELVAEGKIRHIGLSEAGPATIRRAHAVHPRCRPSTPCGPVIRRPSSYRCCASWASASCPTPRSGTASSPGRSAPPRS